MAQFKQATPVGKKKWTAAGGGKKLLPPVREPKKPVLPPMREKTPKVTTLPYRPEEELKPQTLPYKGGQAIKPVQLAAPAQPEPVKEIPWSWSSPYEQTRDRQIGGGMDASAYLHPVPDARKEKGALGEIVHALNVGNTVLPRGRREVEELALTYKENPTAENWKLLNDKHALYQEAVGGYNDAVGGYESYNSDEALAQRVKASEQLVEDLKKQLEEEKGNQGGYSVLFWAAPLLGKENGKKVLDLQRENTASIADLEARIKAAEEEIEQGKYALELRPYLRLAGEKDFAEKSGYVSTANGEERPDALNGMNFGGYDDLDYDVINKNQDATDQKLRNRNATWAGVFGATDKFYEEMTDDEIAIFNYVYTTKGKDAAYEYIKVLQSDLNARGRLSTEEKWSTDARKDPVGMSAMSLLTSPAKGFSYLGQIADYAQDGKIDQNAGYNKFSHINSAIRGEVSGIAEEKWGPVGSFAYQTGMSMGDFLFSTAITGGSQGFTLAIMGTGAAADMTIAAKDRGLSDGQAFALGTIAGAAEIITEKISLNALLDKTALTKNAFGYFLKNVIAEGSEEVGSDFINLFADIMISKDKSLWQQSINAYKADGMDENTAFWHAVGDQALDMGVDFLGGAISGGTMAGGSIAINSGMNSMENRRAGTGSYGNMPQNPWRFGESGYPRAGNGDIDSLIEQMYNEDEPDHFETPAPPEEIPATDAEIIDREWGGGGEAYSPQKIEEFAKAHSAEIKSMTYQEIYDFCKGRKDLAESLILSIPESYGDEGLTLAQRTEKYDLLPEPKAQSLSAYQARVWYRWQESLMAGRLDYSKPLEEVASQACAMRNTIRTQARDAMSDTTWAEFLKTTESNYTFEKLMEYYQEKGYVGNKLWEKIIEKSMQSRKGIDGLFGLSGAQ